MRRETLPQRREPQRLYPKPREAIEIFEPMDMATAFELIVIAIAHAVDGAFHSTPHLKRRHASTRRSSGYTPDAQRRRRLRAGYASAAKLSPHRHVTTCDRFLDQLPHCPEGLIP